jgi:hypothetical protein
MASRRRTARRRLSHESLPSRWVLSATPLAEIAVPENLSMDAVCGPEVSPSAAPTAESTMDASQPGSSPHDGSAPAPLDAALLDAVLAEAASGADSAEGEWAGTPEAGTHLPESWQTLGPTYPVALDTSTSLEPSLGNAIEPLFFPDWNDLGEGEYSDPLAGMEDLEDSEDDDDFIDYWDDTMEEGLTAPFQLTSFLARKITGGWMLEGTVEWPGSNVNGLTVHFDGIASGSTTVYEDGFFAFYFLPPPGWFGTVTAQAADAQGNTSNVLRDYILA